jgi:hypothetical protein
MMTIYRKNKKGENKMKYLILLTILAGCTNAGPLDSAMEKAKEQARNAVDHYKLVSVQDGDTTEYTLVRK